VLRQSLHLFSALESAGGDDRRRHEDEVLEVSRKELLDRQQLVETEPRERRDADRCGGSIALEISGRLGRLSRRQGDEELVELPELLADSRVMRADSERQRDGGARDRE